MGLAAGQARLLSITSRKSDCEFQSMRLSHQKIALSRELADLSNEYQNSLDQTKLIYDYYGTGDTNTPLTYNILMSPSALNDYMPITLTDSSGRVTLNSKYAAAARAAGIPQEGLGTLPSETMRNAFINGLCSARLIDENERATITGLPYNQAAGFGGDTTVAVITDNGNIDDLAAILNENGTQWTIVKSELPVGGPRTDAKGDEGKYSTLKLVVQNDDGSYNHNASETSFSLGDLLVGDKQYMLGYEGIRGEQSPVFGVALMQKYLTDTGSFIDWLYEEFSAVLAIDDVTAACLEYAYSQTQDLIVPNEDEYKYWLTADLGKDTDEDTDYDASPDGHSVSGYLSSVGKKYNDGDTSDDEEYQAHYVEASKDYIGFVYLGGEKGGGNDGNDHATGGINLNNIAKAFLTFFADRMESLSEKDANGNERFSVTCGKAVTDFTNNNLAPDDKLYQYYWLVGSEVSSEDLGQATFYDALFNQICANGWTEDNNIEDKTYLQQMLQSGKLFISKPKDDGYYYQANYATDSYIKEIADETYIAQAEAKYNTEKAKLNSKEETLDMKMKNLDTEISSLTTEYDTVKNTISKNIEKSFKRYNA